MESNWTTLSVMGAVMCTISFLSFQQGLSTDNTIDEPSSSKTRLYVVSMFLSLSLNVLGTCLCALFLIMMLFIPDEYVGPGCGCLFVCLFSP